MKSNSRGAIYDRNGILLAATVTTMSLYVDPSRLLPDHDKLLAEYFKDIDKKIGRSRKAQSKFLWLERHSKRVDEIRALHIPGVYARQDSQRVYPCGQLVSTLIGFCDLNGNGCHGVEYAMNDELQHKDVQLAIDLHIQGILYKHLLQAMCDFEAEGASGMVVDARSGKILGMVSVPTPIKPTDFLDINKRNRNLDPVEVGSVLKLVNIAMALDSGKYTPESMVDSRGPLKVGKFEINDFFGVNKIISLRESLWRSSNIANGRVALSIGAATQKQFFEKLGLLENIEYMNRCRASVLTPKKWKKSTTVTLSYGYGIGITTMHLARAILRILSGYSMNLSLFEDLNLGPGSRILNQTTVDHMKCLMKEVVDINHRRTLGIPGYSIGGKTGTANLCINGQYMEGQNFVTLATTFPTDMPKYLFIIQMTNPKREKLKQGKFTTAGNVLTKYMKEIMQALIKYEGILPMHKNNR